MAGRREPGGFHAEFYMLRPRHISSKHHLGSHFIGESLAAWLHPAARVAGKCGLPLQSTQ